MLTGMQSHIGHAASSKSQRVIGMWQSIAISLVAGILLGNGVPHFVKGITKERYPCMLGNSPTPNLIGGWVCFVASAILVQWVDLQQFKNASLISASIGVLLIGLFHASIGAFGQKD
jgi:hypothetical protein